MACGGLTAKDLGIDVVAGLIPSYCTWIIGLFPSRWFRLLRHNAGRYRDRAIVLFEPHGLKKQKVQMASLQPWDCDGTAPVYREISFLLVELTEPHLQIPDARLELEIIGVYRRLVFSCDLIAQCLEELH